MDLEIICTKCDSRERVRPMLGVHLVAILKHWIERHASHEGIIEVVDLKQLDAGE